MTWFVKSCLNILNEFDPSNEYIATKLADLKLSLKNFNPIPGATIFPSGALADESLTIPFLASFNIPVYEWFSLETNSQSAVTETVWISFFLSKAENRLLYI